MDTPETASTPSIFDEQLAAARAMVAAADAKAMADAQIARDARNEALRAIVDSPAYAEVRDRITAIAPAFMSDGAHVPYLVTALNQVAGLVYR